MSAGPAAGSWSARSRGFSWGWWLVFAVLRGIGRRAAAKLARLIALWYVPFAPSVGIEGYRTHVAPGASPWGFRWRVYGNFAEAIVDRLAFTMLGPPAFAYVRENAEVMVNALTSKRGALFLSAHFGNVEVTSGPAATSARLKKLHVLRFVADTDHGQMLLNAMGDDWRPNIIAVNRAEGLSTLAVARVLRAGGVIAMHGDRLVDERAVSVQLFGEACLVPSGPWYIAALARVPVIVVGCFKNPDGTYHVVCSDPVECTFARGSDRDQQVAAWAQDYARTLEKWGGRWPDQWYNFHDVWRSEAPKPPPNLASHPPVT